MDRELFRGRARIRTQDCLSPPRQAAFQHTHLSFLARHPSGIVRRCTKRPEAHTPPARRQILTAAVGPDRWAQGTRNREQE